MQNKYINSVFYSVIIAITISCGVLTFYRFSADIYFDLARRSVRAYALRNEGKDYMQWAYREAVRRNPCQSNDYGNILNSNYRKIIIKEIQRQRGK